MVGQQPQEVSIQSSVVHLHVHSEYSLLDGIIRVSDLPEAVKAQGGSAVALTDHNNLSGALKFVRACRAAGVKPIVGLEISTTERRTAREKDSLDQKYYHLLLLAQNSQGWKNLVKLSSLAFREGFYYTGRVDEELLGHHSDGLLCTSACLGSRIAKTLKLRSVAEAEQLILTYKALFPDRFFLELQVHPEDPDQRVYNQFLVQASLKTEIPLVVTCDAHYLTQEDRILHEQVLCIQTQATIHDEKRLSFGNREHWLKSPQELSEGLLREGLPLEAISNTLHVAEMCEGVYFNEGKIAPLPVVYPDIVTSPALDLKRKAKWGLVRRFGSRDAVPLAYRERLARELDVIDHLGFSGYFLVVHDYLKAADKMKIRRGPGRGSLAGSLVAWALGFTAKALDPILLDLPFERFLNEARRSPPDADCDFQHSRRSELFAYLKQRYGAAACAHLGTHSQYKPKSLLRDLARVQGLPTSLGDRLASLVPIDKRGRSPTIQEALEQAPALRKHPEILNGALKLDRMTSRAGVHASGYVIYNGDLSDYIPTYRTATFEEITQWDMEEIDELGLTKFDILGLSNLDVVDRTLALIRKRGEDIDLDIIPTDNPETYALIGAGRVAGVFQLEDSLRHVAIRVQPKNLAELSLVNAIGRPGPLDAGLLDRYLLAKETQRPPVGMHPKLAALLKDTGYVPIYQEDVMRIATNIADFTPIEADNLRYAVGKKKAADMDALGPIFRHGCIQKSGFTEEEAQQLWGDIEKYADYAFNRGHAYSYSLLSYWQAYLKTHYPAEFMTALMSEKKDQERLGSYVRDARRIGLQIVGPDINQGDIDFIIKDSKILWGFQLIKGLGMTAARQIVRARGNIPFKDFTDFFSRIDRQKLNSARVQTLILAGAFDSLGYDRQELLAKLESFVEYFKQLQTYREKIALCDERDQKLKELEAAGTLPGRLKKLKCPVLPVPPVAERTPLKLTLDLLLKEKEVLGYYLSAHPSDLVQAKKATDCIADASQKGQNLVINCTISKTKELTTRTGARMAFLDVDDGSGEASITVFPTLWEKRGPLTKSSAMVRIMCKVEDPLVSPVKLIAEKIRVLEVS